MSDPKWHLFERVGVELEYMLVDRKQLSVLPKADLLLESETGSICSDVERGDVAWSNELALHVIELKTNGPVQTLRGLSSAMAGEIQHINQLLAPLGGRLMPTAMHPLMDPWREMRLWPHDSNPVYEAFHRIFDCRGHGWANLQSTHINLPFYNDEEFARLHAAIRLILPILPGLAASSPVMDGQVTGTLDNRLAVYQNNAARVPSVSGAVIPEAVYSERAYENEILGTIYRDMAALDPEGVLRFEWCNARGAIARFDRHAIEIRVLDIQECPLADCAVVALVVDTVRMLVAERDVSWAAQQAWSIERLAPLLHRAIAQGEQAVIDNSEYAQLFGYKENTPCTVQQLWQHIFKSLPAAAWSKDPELNDAVSLLLRQGTLARRIVSALGRDPTPGRITEVYGQLCECLANNRMFVGERL